MPACLVGWGPFGLPSSLIQSAEQHVMLSPISYQELSGVHAPLPQVCMHRKGLCLRLRSFACDFALSGPASFALLAIGFVLVVDWPYPVLRYHLGTVSRHHASAESVALLTSGSS